MDLEQSYNNRLEQYSRSGFDYSSPVENKGRKKRYGIFAIIFIIIVGVLYYALVMAPGNFPRQVIVSVESGKTLGQIASDLKAAHIIKSEFAFQTFAILSGGEKRVIAGNYLFENPVPVFVVASRIVIGERHLKEVKVTFPEGFTIKEMAATLSEELPGFSATDFLVRAQGKEGYLFPDTYFFYPGTSNEIIISTMSNTFSDKLAAISADVSASGHSTKDIIIMASLVEKEANGPEDRALIAGILWNRISQGMALQVDATFLYTIGKSSSELTVTDLESPSLYNTYTHRGLPPGPIGNPGLAALEAALHPTKSSYLFYLHDKNGAVHYAKTFDEHKANKLKYL